MDIAPRLSAVNLGSHAEGGFALAVFGKRTYSVARGGCTPADVQIPLVEEPLALDDPVLLTHECEVLLNRTLTDVVVVGHAHAPKSGGVPHFDASIAVGPVACALHVSGPRRVERATSGQMRFTQADKVERVPLTWSSAYGGHDRAAIERYGDVVQDFLCAIQAPPDPRFGVASYPRNPFGRGYLLEATAAGLAACELPLIEDPRHLVTPENNARGDPTKWPLAPLPACPGWLGYNLFPRSVQIGIPPVQYDSARIAPADFFEVQAGWVKPESVLPSTSPDHRFDFRMVQGATPGMRGDVRPGAPARLVGLHPRTPDWRFRLPESTPKMAVKLPGEEAVELTPRIASVEIEPDEDRLMIVWAGEIRTALPLSDEKFDQTLHSVVWRD